MLSRYLLLLAAPAVLSAQLASLTPEARARQVLDMLLAQQYDAIYAMFGPEMKKAVPEAQFKQSGAQIQQLGKPDSIAAAESKKAGGNIVVTMVVRFKPVALQFGVTWAPNGEIAGLWFTQAPPDPAAMAPRPSYSKPAQFTESPITVGSDEWKLPGILTMPKGEGPFPAVVLVHGSGPNDRDETVGPIKPFRDIAEGLASNGIAVLRYDKRTKVYPGKSVEAPGFSMVQETVEDALRAAALMRTQPHVDPARVYVLGHSQGGYMMPRILRGDPKLAGGIVLAGNVRPIEELIVEQSTYIASLQGKGLTAEQQKGLEELRKDPAKVLRLPASYISDLKGYNPAAEAAKLNSPLLILQGERDYQVGMKDFLLWKNALSARANVKFVSYPKLNHLFIAGEGKSTPVEYTKPANVDGAIISEITSWISHK